METLVYVLLKKVTELEIDTIEYKPINPVSHIKSLIYNKNTEVCQLMIQRDAYIHTNTIVPSDLEDEIENTKQLIGTYIEELETNRILIQKNEATLQHLRTIRKLYRSISSVLDNTSPCIYYTLYILSNFNHITHCIRDEYETVVSALYRVAETLYTLKGDRVLTPYISTIIDMSSDPVTRAIFFAYNDSVRNTSTFSSELDFYRQCIILYGSFNQKELTNFVSHIVTNYLYTNHRYPPIIFDALHIIIDELKHHIQTNPAMDWIHHELCLLGELLHRLQYMKSYHEKIKQVVAFEHKCTIYNVDFLRSAQCPVELVCDRIIQSYRYTSIRMNSLVPTLLDNKLPTTPSEHADHHQSEDQSVRIWICIFLVAFFTVLIMKVTFPRT